MHRVPSLRATPPVTSGERESDCALCRLEAVSEGSRLPGANVVIAYVDDELIGLVPADRPGVLLSPREHVATLFDTPQRSAAVLAPLRQLVEAVKSLYSVEEATIEPTTDLPGAPGHVCYQVVPVLPDESDARSDMASRAAKVAERLRQHSATQRHQQSRSGLGKSRRTHPH